MDKTPGANRPFLGGKVITRTVQYMNGEQDKSAEVAELTPEDAFVDMVLYHINNVVVEAERHKLTLEYSPHPTRAMVVTYASKEAGQMAPLLLAMTVYAYMRHGTNDTSERCARAVSIIHTFGMNMSDEALMPITGFDDIVLVANVVTRAGLSAYQLRKLVAEERGAVPAVKRLSLMLCYDDPEWRSMARREIAHYDAPAPVQWKDTNGYCVVP